jgi:hypothetical protein
MPSSVQRELEDTIMALKDQVRYSNLFHLVDRLEVPIPGAASAVAAGTTWQSIVLNSGFIII